MIENLDTIKAEAAGYHTNGNLVHVWHGSHTVSVYLNNLDGTDTVEVDAWTFSFHTDDKAELRKDFHRIARRADRANVYA